VEFKDYYQILGVERDVTQDELKRAYRKLARKYHPDVSSEPDAEARFKEIGEAYEVLKDPEKRAAYDQLGSDWQAGQDFRPPPDWAQGFEFRGGGFTEADPQHFSEFFESLFGHDFDLRGAGRRSGGFSARGEDTHARILIDLEDSFRGAERSVTLKHSELDASGRPALRQRTLKVRIPRGIRRGQHIRLAGQGGAGLGQGKAGDLYLEVEFRRHPLYEVEGSDLYLDLPLAPWEAALGTRVQVPAPDGRVELKIPPNTQGGQKLRLKGKGLPASRPGDLYVVVRIALPPADTPERVQAWERLRDAGDFNPRKHFGGTSK
jgi:curved DNA-binding protein